MKKIFLTAGCFLLLVGQFAVGGGGGGHPTAAAATAAAAAAAPSDPVTGRAGNQTATTLTVRANLYFGGEDQDSEPVTTDFYLLDQSLIAVLKRARFKPVFADGVKRRVRDEDYLEAAAKVLLSQPDDEAALLALLINEQLARHQTAFAYTDGAGRGRFKAIRAGKYYLFGIKKIEDQTVVWHLPILVKPGGNAIELDQHNAAAIFSEDD